MSLNKETVSSLNENDKSGMPQTRQVTNCLDCRTIYTCQTKCEQFSCVGCEEATFQSNCMCLSDNVQCESNGCINSKSATPICCELPDNSTPGGICRLTEGVCNVSNDDACASQAICVVSYNCVETERMCAISEEVDVELSVCMCPVETRINCEGE